MSSGRMPAMRVLPVVLICRRPHCLRRRANQWPSFGHPAPLEGRIAIVTDVGCGKRLDAMPAWDERLAIADGKGVWS